MSMFTQNPNVSNTGIINPNSPNVVTNTAKMPQLGSTYMNGTKPMPTATDDAMETEGTQQPEDDSLTGKFHSWMKENPYGLWPKIPEMVGEGLKFFL